MRLQSKTLILLTPAIVLPMLALGMFAYIQLKETSEKTTLGQMSTLLNQIQLQTDSYLDTAKSNITLFSKDALVTRYMLEDDEAERYRLLQRPLLSLLLSYQKGYPYYYEIRILLPDGYEDTRSTAAVIPNKTEEEGDTELFNAIKNAGNQVFSIFAINPDNGEYAFFVSKAIKIKDPAVDPILAEPRLRGYLIITADLQFLAQQQSQSKIGKQGGVFFTDRFGRLLFPSEETAARWSYSDELFKTLLAGVGKNETVRGELSQVPHIIRGLEIIDNLFAFAALPERELFQSSRRLGAFVAGITLLATIIASLLIFTFVSRIVINPIRDLQRVTKRISEGNLDVEIHIDRGDEIGDLAGSFREMGKSLQSSSEQITYLAYHDVLTGLPNRSLFTEHLDTAVAHARRRREILAVLFFDLDNFKQVNDTLGHSAGDTLLKELSKRLITCVRQSDLLAVPDSSSETVARVGGDEFLLLLPDIQKPQDAATVAQRLLQAASEPFSIKSYEFHVGMSIGISIYPNDGDNASALIKNADVAMYHAKKDGKGAFHFYSEDMNKAALERLSLENDLRRAIEAEQLELMYQPIVDAVTQRVVAVEALARWNHPERGRIAPSNFIPLAEDTGLIVALGEWVLRTACLQAKSWRDKGLPAVNVSVNVSNLQLRKPEFAESVREILRKTGTPADLLELELTESSIMQAPDEDLRTLESIKSLGVGISMDDFGTGYSSLSSLRSLPIDTLKIDRDFVKDIPGDEDDAIIVTVIINMARLLKLNIVAEGVETMEQFEFLVREGCNTLQGYLLSRPAPPEEIEKFLAENAASIPKLRAQSR